MKCIRCNSEVETERIALGLNMCKYCAGMTVKKYKGSMIYSHKTSPVIDIMSSDYYDTEWKRYNPKYGRGSGVHAMSRPYKTK